MTKNPHEHLSAERLQALLDGELPARERALSEEHLAACARCSAELDAWRVLFEDLRELSTHRPLEGFSDRVMAGVVPAHHVDELVLHEYLDGALGRRKAAAVEAHLAACAPCAEEAGEWSALLARLDGLERLAPAEGFAERVIAALPKPERLSLGARARARLAALLPAAAAHPAAGRLQDFVDGVLPARQVARIAAHVRACATCAEEVGAWRAVVARLESLERPAPGAGFADRVMAGVRIPAPVPVRARRAELARAWSRAPARARALVPRTRRAWAAISGVAVTPAVVTSLVLYAVFSHPTVTPASLLSFVWWQVSDVAAGGWTALSGALLQSAELFSVYSVFGELASAPFAVAGGALAYSLVSVLALRVLYRNIIANRPMDGRHVRVSAT